MLFDEADSELLKKWVIKRLETVSDADPDVLGDYVLALVSTDDPESVAKANCNDNLKDFLGDASDTFVDELFQAIANHSFNPSKPKPPTAPIYQPPRRTSIEPSRQQNESRKRSYHDWDRDESQHDHIFESGQRPTKQPRRGGRGGRQQHHLSATQFHQPPFPQMPTPPPGMPQFDMNNPIASFMALQQAMGISPGFPPPDQNGNSFPQKQRCRDFDNKGFCTRGAACPFDHGTDLYVVPNDEYDPNQATLLHVQPSRTGIVHTSPSSKGRGRGRGRGGSSSYRGGGKRSDLSLQGQNHDRSITTIVVEQIPEDKFEEQTVRDFFADFGNIEEISMKPYKRLAVVKYKNYESARAAYESPKVIFDNRFVKVYWYNSYTLPVPQNGHGETHTTEEEEEEPHLNSEEIVKKQEEAQRKHEEQKRQREEAENKKKEIDAQVKAIEAERKKMAEAIAKKCGKATSPDTAADNPTESEQTKGLRAQLAKLEAEAKSLGIDPNLAPSGYNSGGQLYSRGRGGFRGRHRGRETFYPSFHSSWPGGGVGAVKRLDNRPKTVAITFAEGTYEDHDEALRQWLLFNALESASLTKHPTADAALLAFTERYLGENFMAAAASPGFPLFGKVELNWYKPESTGKPATPTVPNATSTTINDGEMQDEAPTGRDMYDRADDDDDRWG